MPGNRNNEEFITLVKKYMEGKASEQEILFLEKYYNYFEKEPAFIETLSHSEKEVLESEILQALRKKVKGEAVIVPFYNNKWFRAAAAVIFILLATGTFFLLTRKKQNEIATINKEQTKPDVKPGGNKAILTLGDHSQIILDNAANGTLTQQGNTEILKLSDGQIAYNPSGKATELIYNTITTPKGGQYQLTLSDGSKVWLNAASSIRFPTSFVGKERKVEITGEVYFEVAKNASMPFRVDIAGTGEVEVLGTHFNINAYGDEPDIKATLLEGSIKITNDNATVLLRPSMQAKIQNNDITVVQDVDVDQVVAWQRGMFEFEHTELPVIMRQISRWYDVEISYEGKIAGGKFGGGISRNLPLSSVLKSLESTGIHFRLDGKKLIVTP